MDILDNRNYHSFFIENDSKGWILEILGNDIFSGMKDLGYACRKGGYEDYQGEDISFHMWWVNALPHKGAKVNAVFVTHTDDEFKEDRLKRIKDKFDLFFCMSPEDAQFLIELGFDQSKVYGINLPVRNNYVRPMTVGIFSRCYPNKCKNEEWLFDFCNDNPNSKILDYVFIGDGWGDFVQRLSSIGCSFQWHNVSRNIPYEYMYQQIKLSNLDYYIYMGMDGGAMGTYDAYAMGASLCVTDDGFHKCIPQIDYSFSNKKEFCEKMAIIANNQLDKLNFFADNNVMNYVSKIAYIIENGKYPETCIKPYFNYSVEDKRRSFYFNRGKLYKIYNMLCIVVNNYINKLKLENRKFEKE